MGGKGSGGRRENSFGSQLRDPTVDASVNSRIMRFGKELLSMGELDYADADAVWERFCEYLELCDEFGIRPMVNSMAQAFNTNRQTLWGIATGNEHFRHWKGITPESVDVFKKAYDFLQTSWEIYLTEEKGNPVKWFFLAKNYFGYEDQTVKVQRVEVDRGALPSPEEVAAKYALQVGRQQEPLLVEAEVVDSGE